MKRVTHSGNRRVVLVLSLLVGLGVVGIGAVILRSMQQRTLMVDLQPGSRQRLLETLRWTPQGELDFRVFDEFGEVVFVYGPVELHRLSCDRVIVSSEGARLSAVRVEQRIRNKSAGALWAERIRLAFVAGTGCTTGRPEVPFTIRCHDYAVFVEVRPASFGFDRGLLGVCEVYMLE